MYTILWYLLSTLCHRAVQQYVLPLRELPQCSFIQEDLMKITLFKILHAVCICIVMSTQSDLPFRILYCGHLSGSTAFYYGHSLLQILFIADASLIRAPLHYRQSITDISPFWTPLCCKHTLLQTLKSSNMVFITDIFYYGHLSCVKTSLLRTLLWKPLYYGHLSTASTHQLQTSLIWTCLYYGHLSVSTANTH